jgi:hypothetical protein
MHRDRLVPGEPPVAVACAAFEPSAERQRPSFELGVVSGLVLVPAGSNSEFDGSRYAPASLEVEPDLHLRGGVVPVTTELPPRLRDHIVKDGWRLGGVVEPRDHLVLARCELRVGRDLLINVGSPALGEDGRSHAPRVMR